MNKSVFTLASALTVAAKSKVVWLIYKFAGGVFKFICETSTASNSALTFTCIAFFTAASLAEATVNTAVPS